VYQHLAEPLEYRPPWAIPYEVRRQWLSERDVHIAYVYELEDTSTFRYRVFNMVEALRSDPALHTSAGWFTREEFHDDSSFVDMADVLVICRTRYDDGVARLVERARARGVLVLFDVDDLVFNLQMVHPIVHTLDVYPTTEEHWNYWYAYVGRLNATLRLCDGALTTTEFLKRQILAYDSLLPCSVIPNYLNRKQTEDSEFLFAKKLATGFRRDGWVTMGYFSGSQSHNKDLMLASPAIAEAMNDHPDLRLRIVGFIDLNEHLTPFGRRVEHLPLQDYLNLQRVTAECEFSIAPLQLTTFTRCKSELKYFEPAIVGCPTIASPTPAFSGAIADGSNGLIAEVDEWREKIETFYSGARTLTDDFLELAKRARTDSLFRYGWDRQGARILDAIRDVRQPAGRSTSRPQRELADREDAGTTFSIPG